MDAQPPTPAAPVERLWQGGMRPSQPTHQPRAACAGSEPSPGPRDSSSREDVALAVWAAAPSDETSLALALTLAPAPSELLLPGWDASAPLWTSPTLGSADPGGVVAMAGPGPPPVSTQCLLAPPELEAQPPTPAAGLWQQGAGLSPRPPGLLLPHALPQHAGPHAQGQLHLPGTVDPQQAQVWAQLPGGALPPHQRQVLRLPPTFCAMKLFTQWASPEVLLRPVVALPGAPLA